MSSIADLPTIMIAEDEHVNYLLLEMWLKGKCHILHATDGNEAIELFEKHPEIALILMDIKMPYTDGKEATKAIRKINGTIPILAQSAFVMDYENQDILESGCNAVLNKPIRKEEFNALLNKFLPNLNLN